MRYRLTRCLVRLAGADPRLLKWVPEETRVFVVLALAMLSTAGFGGLYMGLALKFVGTATWLSIAAAACWATIVLYLDRTLITTIQQTKDRKRSLFVVLVRLLVSLTCAVVIATPLTLMVFQSEITIELDRSGKGSGLLAQLDALDTLTSRSNAVAVVQWAMILLLAVLEGLPSLIAVLRLFGPSNNYERIREVDEAHHHELRTLVDRLKQHRTEALRQIVTTREGMTTSEREFTLALGEFIASHPSIPDNQADEPAVNTRSGGQS